MKQNSDIKLRSNSLEQILDENNETKYNSPILEKYYQMPWQLDKSFSMTSNDLNTQNYQNELQKMIISHEIDDNLIDEKIIPDLRDDSISKLDKIKIIDDLIYLGREESIKGIFDEGNHEILLIELLQNNDIYNSILYMNSLCQLYQDELAKLEKSFIKFQIYFKDNKYDVENYNSDINLMMQEILWYINRFTFINDQISFGINIREINNYTDILKQQISYQKELNQNYQQVQPQFKLTAAISRLYINRRVGMILEDIPLQVYSEYGPIIPIRSWHLNSDLTLRGSVKKLIKKVYLTFPKQQLINWEQFKLLNNEDRKIYLFTLLKYNDKNLDEIKNYNIDQLNGLKRVQNYSDNVEKELNNYVFDNIRIKEWDDKKKNYREMRSDLQQSDDYQNILFKEFSEEKIKIIKNSMLIKNDMWRI